MKKRKEEEKRKKGEEKRRKEKEKRKEGPTISCSAFEI